MKKEKLISFAQIYGHDSIPKTSGTEEVLENNNVYDVSDFTKGNNNGGWNLIFLGILEKFMLIFQIIYISKVSIGVNIN